MAMTLRSKLSLKVGITFLILFICLEILMVKFNLREAIFQSFLFSEQYKYLSFIILIAFSICTSYIGFIVAQKKNRTKSYWALLCFLLNIWGLMVLLFLPSREKNSENGVSP